MKKQLIKAAALFTALLILITALPMSATAATTDSETVSASSGTTGDCTWTLDDKGVLTISGNGEMGEGSPWGTDIQSVVIQYGVTNISKRAFRYCEKLAAVDLSQSISIIDEEAFEGCINLQKITIPDSVNSIGNYAFNYCRSLTSVLLPKNLTEIKQAVFRRCTALMNIEIPSTVKRIGYYAFSECSSLTKITIPYGVVGIYDAAFKDCSSLSTISISDSVIEFGDDVFSGTLWWNNMPDGAVYINNCLLDYHGVCPTELTVIEGTKKIYGFKKQNNLVKINIPNSVETIGNNAFLQCSSLKYAELPYNLSSIGDYSFAHTALERVYLPNSLNTLGQGAFACCLSLKSVHLSEKLPNLSAALSDINNGACGGGAFNNCENLTELVIPKSINYIYSAFSGCFRLKRVLAFNPDFWCYGAFASSATIYKINPSDECTIDLKENVLTISGDGAMANYTVDNPSYLSLFSEVRSNVTTLFVEKGVTSIGNYAFADLPNLTSVTLPSTVTRIGEHAFDNAAALISIAIPASVTEIGEDAFVSCENLTIYGYDGSYAQSYANDHNIPFVVLKAFGDANGDNKINVRDITAIQRHLAEYQPLTTAQSFVADVDGNGKVNIHDATHLQMYLAEYEDVVLG